MKKMFFVLLLVCFLGLPVFASEEWKVKNIDYSDINKYGELTATFDIIKIVDGKDTIVSSLAASGLSSEILSRIKLVGKRIKAEFQEKENVITITEISLDT